MKALHSFLQTIVTSSSEIQSELAYQSLVDELEVVLPNHNKLLLKTDLFQLVTTLLARPMFYQKAGLWRVLCLLNSKRVRFSEWQMLELITIFDEHYDCYEQPLLLASLQVWSDKAVIDWSSEACLG